MISRLRIWRVEPTSDTGIQAPTYFVETQDNVLEKAEKSAIELAKQKSVLSKFDTWNFRVIKQSVRKDEFGRYIRHHQ